MRRTLALLGGLLVLALLFVGCDNGKNGTTAKRPTATPAPTVQQVLVNAQDLPSGCMLENEGSIIQGYFARSFDCGEVRLTYAVGLLRSEDEARTWQSDRWGTRDGFGDLIKESIAARPVDLGSLRYNDVTGSLPKVGADEERLWCASFTDSSGTQRVTEYWGGYRHRTAVVQYTASALTPGGCENASRLPELAHTLATAQLNKLRVAMK